MSERLKWIVRQAESCEWHSSLGSWASMRSGTPFPTYAEALAAAKAHGGRPVRIRVRKKEPKRWVVLGNYNRRYFRFGFVLSSRASWVEMKEQASLFTRRTAEELAEMLGGTVEEVKT